MVKAFKVLLSPGKISCRNLSTLSAASQSVLLYIPNEFVALSGSNRRVHFKRRTKAEKPPRLVETLASHQRIEWRKDPVEAIDTIAQ